MKKLGWIVGCVLMCLVGGAAQAQSTDSDFARDWDFRMGIFIPERSVSREKGGDVWFSFGAERTFYETERLRSTVSIDYYGAGGIYNVPLLLNLRSDTGRMRYGVGLGVSAGHDADRGQTSFAYSLGAGFDLVPGTKPVTFDIKYLGTGQSHGQLNGWQFMFGTRF